MKNKKSILSYPKHIHEIAMRYVGIFGVPIQITEGYKSKLEQVNHILGKYNGKCNNKKCKSLTAQQYFWHNEWLCLKCMHYKKPEYMQTKNH